MARIAGTLWVTIGRKSRDVGTFARVTGRGRLVASRSMASPAGTEMWTDGGIAAVADMVARSPSVPGPRPWALRFVADGVEVHERPADRPLIDPLGRDRILSCGAAVATLEAVLRHRGLKTALELPSDFAGTLLAHVRVVGPMQPSELDDAIYAAITARHSDRRAFSSRPVDPMLAGRLIAASCGPDVSSIQVSRIRREAQTEVLARQIVYAAHVLRADVGYQRELTAWTRPPSSTVDTLPWGLVRESTNIPDSVTLANRLKDQTTLLLTSVDDGRVDHLQGGIVTQRLWLGAIADGLCASVHSQSLQLPEVRARLRKRLKITGYPHIVMRLGHPTQRRSGGHADR